MPIHKFKLFLIGCFLISATLHISPCIKMSSRLFPENIFHQTKLLTWLDISYNPIDLGKTKFIGDRFKQMLHLGTVLLKGLGKSPTQNCSFDRRFLSPLSNVETIDLSESLILQGYKYLVQSLHHTSILIINNMDGYKSCPAHANELFKNIPLNVTDLQATHWTTI